MRSSESYEDTLASVIVGSSEGDDAEIQALFHGTIDKLASDAYTSREDLIEHIDIVMSEQGDITVATTLKLPNLRFRLGDFLLEATSTAVSAASSPERPLVLALTAIKFIRTVRNLATIEIDREDAVVLLEIYKQVRDEGMVTVDVLGSTMDKHLASGDLARSLERLDRLGCIVLDDGEIQLNETIVVRRKE